MRILCNFRFMRNPVRARISRASQTLVVLMLAAMIAAVARADTPAGVAAGLSDAAFAMLNAIDADPKSGGAMLAPVASLASDAQSLQSALEKDDRSAAGHAMAAVVRDRDQIDAARAAKGAPALPQWNSVKGQIAALEAQVTPVAGPIATSAPPPSSPAAPSASLAPEAPKAPQVVINSRSFSQGAVHVRGFFEGTDLKSAGIFDGSAPVKMVKVSDVSGEQRVNFDFGIQDPSPTQTIEVTDGLGRVARAQVAPDAAALTHSRDGHEKMIELGGSTMDSEAVASSGPAAVASSRNNTEEIPRADGSESASGAPGRRLPGGVEGPLTNVQINVLGVMPSSSQPGGYEVIGQITGAGVHRAGVYVNGRMMKPIPIGAGGYNSFDVSFQMPPGQQATIRAYGLGRNFVEASVDSSGTGMSTASAPPLMVPGMSPYGYPASPYGYGGAAPYGAPVYSGGYPPGYGAPGYGAPGYGGYPGYGAPGYGYPPGAAMPWYRRLIP
ncbi:MAG TPA: hypothetical protein VMV27_13755 [Candidatus Binataceae bacterium]|nr:hypothetical protein [Candidatus Binataceae bacterium]